MRTGKVELTLDEYDLHVENGRRLVEKVQELANKEAEINKIINTIADKNENVVVVNEARAEIWKFDREEYKVQRSTQYHYATKEDTITALTEKITELKKHNTDYHNQMKKLLAENSDLKKQLESVKPKKRCWQ